MNCVYSAPRCGDLPTHNELSPDGLSITCVWKPSAEDLEVLNSGGCICLNVIGGQPPVALWAQEIHIID